MISVESRWASLRQNGQKRSEEIYKDGELISEEWWNSKGEEVETEEEARKYPPHHGAGTRVRCTPQPAKVQETGWGAPSTLHLIPVT